LNKLDLEAATICLRITFSVGGRNRGTLPETLENETPQFILMINTDPLDWYNG